MRRPKVTKELDPNTVWEEIVGRADDIEAAEQDDPYTGELAELGSELAANVRWLRDYLSSGKGMPKVFLENHQ